MRSFVGTIFFTHEQIRLKCREKKHVSAVFSIADSMFEYQAHTCRFAERGRRMQNMCAPRKDGY